MLINAVRQPNYYQQLGSDHGVTDKGVQYVGQVAMSIACLNRTTGIFATALATSAKLQNKNFDTCSLVDLLGAIASVLAPKACGVICSIYGSVYNIRDFQQHMIGREWRQAALDVAQLGNNVLYCSALVSRNKVVIAISMLTKGAFELVQAGSHIYEQIESGEHNKTVYAAAALQVGLAALRGYQVSVLLQTRPIAPAKQNLENGKVTGKLNRQQLETVNGTLDLEGGETITHVCFNEKGMIDQMHMQEMVNGQTATIKADYSKPHELHMTMKASFDEDIGVHSFQLKRMAYDTSSVRKVDIQITHNHMKTDFVADRDVDYGRECLTKALQSAVRGESPYEGGSSLFAIWENEVDNCLDEIDDLFDQQYLIDLQ